MGPGFESPLGHHAAADIVSAAAFSFFLSHSILVDSVKTSDIIDINIGNLK